MQDLTNYALFVKVVEHSGISAAARAMNMPKSTLSRRISDLEEHLGVRLLNRTTRQLNLTDVGREVLVHSQTLLDAAQAAEHVSQQVREQPRGRVRVSCPYAISESLLQPILPDFMALYPEITIDLMTTNHPVNLIEQHVDIALRVRPFIEDSSLIARSIIASPPSLVAAPQLVSRLGVPRHPRELVSWPTLSLHQSSGRYQWQFSSASKEKTGERYTLTYQPRLITDDMGMLKAAAIKQQGIIVLPNFICREELASGELVRVLPDWHTPAGILHLVYAQRRGLLPAVRSLVEFLVKNLPEVAGAAGVGELE